MQRLPRPELNFQDDADKPGPVRSPSQDTAVSRPNTDCSEYLEKPPGPSFQAVFSRASFPDPTSQIPQTSQLTEFLKTQVCSSTNGASAKSQGSLGNPLALAPLHLAGRGAGPPNKEKHESVYPGTPPTATWSCWCFPASPDLRPGCQSSASQAGLGHHLRRYLALRFHPPRGRRHPDGLGRGQDPAPVKEAWGAAPGTDVRLKQKPQMGLSDRSDDRKLAGSKKCEVPSLGNFPSIRLLRIPPRGAGVSRTLVLQPQDLNPDTHSHHRLLLCLPSPRGGRGLVSLGVPLPPSVPPKVWTNQPIEGRR